MKYSRIKIILVTITMVITAVVLKNHIKRSRYAQEMLYILSTKVFSVNENLITFLNRNVSQLDLLDQKDLALGKIEMSKHKVVIAGITRDNVKNFFIMAKNIEYIGKNFKDYRVVLFENDSTDGTKRALETWQHYNPKVSVITKDFKVIKRPNIKFLADSRNEYLEELKKDTYSDFDILMVVDMDIGKGIDIRGIRDSFSKISKWDAVCSNGILQTMNGAMYDAFAFRNKEFPWTPIEWNTICVADDDENKFTRICRDGARLIKDKNTTSHINLVDDDSLYWRYIVPQISKIYDINSDMVEVESCFGGMAFYKMDFIKNCAYDSIKNDCEHVEFHKCVINQNGARMFMNPNQVIRYN